MQHCWQTTHSQHCRKLHVVSISTYCCLLLYVVWTCTVQSLKPVKLLVPCKWTQHCWPTTPNIVGSCCIRLHVALSVNCGVTKEYTRLCSGELCLESDSFALNQKDILIFLKNVFGTKRTVSVKIDTILLTL